MFLEERTIYRNEIQCEEAFHTSISPDQNPQNVNIWNQNIKKWQHGFAVSLLSWMICYDCQVYIQRWIPNLLVNTSESTERFLKPNLN